MTVEIEATQYFTVEGQVFHTPNGSTKVGDIRVFFKEIEITEALAPYEIREFQAALSAAATDDAFFSDYEETEVPA